MYKRVQGLGVWIYTCASLSLARSLARARALCVRANTFTRTPTTQRQIPAFIC
jgi:hypothetical protein